jgi:hypothetical protein
MLHLYFVDGLNVSEVNDEFAHRQVPLPSTFDIGSLITMSPKNLSNATSNVKEVCRRLVNDLHVAWALTFANESRSYWKILVGREIATWLSMPPIILGLHFESELGLYFEEAYA